MAVVANSPTAFLDAGQGSPQAFGSTRSLPGGFGLNQSLPSGSAALPGPASWSPAALMTRPLPTGSTSQWSPHLLDQTVEQGGAPMSMMMSNNPFSIGGGQQQLPQLAGAPSAPGPRITSVPGPPPPPMSPFTIMPTAAMSASGQAPPMSTFGRAPPAYSVSNIGTSAQMTGPQPAYSMSTIGTGAQMRPGPSSMDVTYDAGPQAASTSPLAYSSVDAAATQQFLQSRPDASSTMPSNLPPQSGSAAVGWQSQADPQSRVPIAHQGDLHEFLVYHAQQEPIQTSLGDDFGLAQRDLMKLVRAVGAGVSKGMASMTFEDEVEEEEEELPYGMTPQEHEEYKVSMQLFKKAEKPIEEKKELHHVENVHKNIEHAKAGHLEKNLLYLREDQLMLRFNMLEQIAAASPNETKEAPQQALWNEAPTKRPFMDKFLPVPLGGGTNWHYFNHHEGYYIDKSKISRREAQLKHLQEQHRHQMVQVLAGSKSEEIPEDYWDRDYKAWLQKQQDQMQDAMQQQQQLASSGDPVAMMETGQAFNAPPTSGMNALPGSSMMQSAGGLNPFASVRNPTSALMIPAGASGASLPSGSINPFASTMLPSAGTIGGGGGMNTYASGMMPSMTPTGGMTTFGSAGMSAPPMTRMY